jgi:hypothetical protein
LVKRSKRTCRWRLVTRGPTREHNQWQEHIGISKVLERVLAECRYASRMRAVPLVRTAGLGVKHVCDLDKASPYDSAVCKLLSGGVPERITILTTQLLTDTHSAVLRALKVCTVQRRPGPSFRRPMLHQRHCQSALLVLRRSTRAWPCGAPSYALFRRGHMHRIPPQC